MDVRAIQLGEKLIIPKLPQYIPGVSCILLQRKDQARATKKRYGHTVFTWLFSMSRFVDTQMI